MSLVALHDSDNTKFPNLALMKLSAYHKAMEDKVEWFIPAFHSRYDKIYSSKVFTYTKDNIYLPTNTIKGGTGYDLTTNLDYSIEHTCPDYSLYDLDYSIGFLTRGCIKKCSYCVVPKKEGKIRPNTEIDEFLRHDKVVLLDNNILAHEHGIKQIEKLGSMKVKVDFNQGLDATFIDDSIAKLLSKLKYIKVIRLACDSYEKQAVLQKAVMHLRWRNVRPSRYFVYCLITDDLQESMDRIKFIKGLNCEPFAQPFISLNGKVKPTQKQKDLARFVNVTSIFNSIYWEDYEPTFTQKIQTGIFR